jgi:hypothetical protein
MHHVGLFCGCCRAGEHAKLEAGVLFGTSGVIQRPWVLATRHNVDVVHEGVTPLMLAVRACNVNQAKMLLAAGADPLAVCSVAGGNGAAAAAEQAGEGWSTPLHAAGQRRHNLRGALVL